MLDLIVFWGAAIVAIVSTLMVLLSRNPFYATLYLILSLFGVSLIFFTLGATFLAAVEIIVYAGAIMVLFLFVVQMLSPGTGPSRDEDLQRPTWKQLAIPGALAIVLLAATLLAMARGWNPIPGTPQIFSARILGYHMFQNHFLGVKLASLILLIGTIGGMHLGRASSYDQDEETRNAAR